MLYHRFQKFNRDERGHAMVIGAIGLLAMAVAIATSVSIGNAVYEKVKLQDASDAQAYSLAAKTARVYNFLAYTNRTMVVHHCAAMTFSAWLSHTYYIKMVVGNLCKVLSVVPFIGPFFNGVAQAIDRFHQAVEYVVKILLWVMVGLNAALHLAQLLIVNGMAAEFMAVGGAIGAGRKTDGKARINDLRGALASAVSIVLNGRNSTEFYKIIDGKIAAPGDQFKLYSRNDLSDEKMARYRMLMGNIANAERRKYTSGAQNVGPVFIGRVFSLPSPPIPCIKGSKTALGVLRNYEDSSIKDRIDARDGFDLTIKAYCAPKWLGGDGPTLIRVGFGFGMFADMNGGGYSMGFSFDPGGIRVNWPLQRGGFTWYGITGYYLAKPSFSNPTSDYFGQPSFAIVGTKDMRSSRQVFEMRTNIVTGDGTFRQAVQGQNQGQLDLTWQGKAANAGGLGIFENATGGMMTLSAARATYHRPGAWKEAPNFFNPLWTAHLVPAESAGLAWAAAAEPAMLLFRGGLSGPTFNY